MNPVLIDPQGVAKIIESLKVSSSPSSDLITAKFLKNTVLHSSVILAHIFQQSLDRHTVPADWKVGKVVPIHKSGKKDSPNNYRPISLTSIPCKLLEHILYSHLVTFLETNSFFSPYQHGFRKTFSCETPLLCFTHNLNTILDRGSCADCLFLDFSKAFDKVCHKSLLVKLSQLNIDSNTFLWIEQFLLNRSQYVTCNDQESSPSPVHSGVPQGSVLGPLLFLIYIIDLPDCVSYSINLFADDCVIFREIFNDNDTNMLQHDIDAVSAWCRKWHMELNTTKCKTMRVSRISSSPAIYHINNVPLQAVTSYRYLGVYITSSLSWALHIEQQLTTPTACLDAFAVTFHLLLFPLRHFCTHPW